MSKAQLKSFWRRRWLRFVIYAALLSAVVLLCTPFVVRYSLEQWLEEHGADRAQIKDVDINPFTGSVALKGMDVKFGGRTVIADSDIDVNVDLLHLFSRQATVQSATLDGIHLEIESRPDGRLRIGSVVLGGKGDSTTAELETGNEERPWWFLVKTLRLTNSTVRYIQPGITSDIEIQHLVVDNLFTGPATTPARAELEGKIDGAPVSVKATGTVNLPDTSATGSLTVTGLQIDRYSELLQVPLKQLSGKLDLDGRYAFDVAAAGLTGAHYDGTLQISAARTVTDALSSDVDKLSWRGKLELTGGDDGGRTVTVAGVLIGDGLSVVLPEGKRHAELKQVELKPDIKLRLGDSKLDAEGDVGIHAENIVVVLPGQGVKHHGGVLDADSKFKFSTIENADKSSKGWAVQIPLATLTGGSTLDYTNSMDPPFTLQITLDKVIVENIDSAAPDKTARFELNGTIGKYGKLYAKGSARPFAKDLFVDSEARLDNVAMAPLSPLMIQSSGYSVQSGELDLESKTVIQNGSIDSQNKTVLSKFHVKKAAGEVAAKTETDIGMPLEKALGMLRDKNDKIKLDIPVAGKLDEVDVGYNSIINIAFKKALKAGAMSYLVYAFQPYGALIYLGEKVGDAAAKISLEPLTFEPGARELTAQHKDYLGKLAKVMSERAQIAVQVCGYVTGADALAMEPRKPNQAAEQAGAKKPVEVSGQMKTQTMKLASQRADAIKAYLVKTYGVEPGRLSVCAPEFDEKPDAKSRVELRI